jgi:hypothetical protein
MLIPSFLLKIKNLFLKIRRGVGNKAIYSSYLQVFTLLELAQYKIQSVAEASKGQSLHLSG